MKTITSFLFAIVIFSSLSSCSNYLLVEKTYDPEINLEKRPYKIAFINIFDYTSPALVREKQENSYRAGVLKLTEGISSSFSRDESISFFPGDSLKKDLPAGQLTALLSKDTILAICERRKTDLLLTLDSMNIFFDWKTIANNDDASLKEKDFYLYTRFYMSFYSSTGDLINRSMVEKSSFYKSRPALSALITFKPSIANAIGMVKSLSFQAGQDYVSKFYPKTVQESRKIYSGKAFKESNLFIKLRNWEKATELLDQLAKSDDPGIAMKARHNLEVVKEASEIDPGKP
jgi:Family of unknown function (DUF6340)